MGIEKIKAAGGAVMDYAMQGIVPKGLIEDLDRLSRTEPAKQRTERRQMAEHILRELVSASPAQQVSIIEVLLERGGGEGSKRLGSDVVQTGSLNG